MGYIEWRWALAHVTVLTAVACGSSSSMDGTQGGGSAGTSASTSQADADRQFAARYCDAVAQCFGPRTVPEALPMPTVQDCTVEVSAALMNGTFYPSTQDRRADCKESDPCAYVACTGALPDCADEDRNACLSQCSPQLNGGAWTPCCINGFSQQLRCASASGTTGQARDYCAEGFGCGVVPPKTDTNNAQVQCDACAGMDAGLVTNSEEGCCCAIYFVPIPASEYEAAFDCTRL